MFIKGLTIKMNDDKFNINQEDVARRVTRYRLLSESGMMRAGSNARVKRIWKSAR